nr:hypothetical protein [Ktedonobacterales bacterium]
MLDQPPAQEAALPFYPAVPTQATQACEDTARREQSPRRGEVVPLSRLASLSRLLVARIPARQALAQALSLGLDALPEVEALRLFLVRAGAEKRLLSFGWARRSGSERGGSERGGSERAPRLTATLGYGAEVDQQVLIEGRHADGDHAQC